MKTNRPNPGDEESVWFLRSLTNLISSCLTFIWDILKWLVLEWELEENQTYLRLIIAKIEPLERFYFFFGL